MIGAGLSEDEDFADDGHREKAAHKADLDAPGDVEIRYLRPPGDLKHACLCAALHAYVHTATPVRRYRSRLSLLHHLPQDPPWVGERVEERVGELHTVSRH